MSKEELRKANEDALEAFADILEPAAEIIADDEVKGFIRDGEKLKAVKAAIKKHKSALIEILARLDGCEPDEYEVSIFTLPAKTIAMLNSPEIQQLFTGQGQNGGVESSGSATGTTTDGET